VIGAALGEHGLAPGILHSHSSRRAIGAPT
jgi:hypothetical protein